MTMQTYLLLPLFFIFSINVFAQEPEVKQQKKERKANKEKKSTLNEEDDAGVQYKQVMTFGIMAHSNGFGANFRRGKHLTGYKKRLYEIEVVNMKHPKEYKVYNPSRENAKGYIFGKLNSVFILRPSIGTQRVITRKADEGGVELRFNYFVGVSLAFLKPVYLEITYKLPDGNEEVRTEKYNPDEHSTYNIYGKAHPLKGIEETKILPGGVAKFGLSFEYGKTPKKIRCLETGIALDVYYKNVPIMAHFESSDYPNPNNMFFLSFYLSINYGKRW